MIFIDYTFIRKNVPYGVGRLCACLEPVKGSVKIKLDVGRIGDRIVGANLFNKFSIPWCSTIRYDDMVKRPGFFTPSLQSDFCWHNKLIIII